METQCIFIDEIRLSDGTWLARVTNANDNTFIHEIAGPTKENVNLLAQQYAREKGYVWVS